MSKVQTCWPDGHFSGVLTDTHTGRFNRIWVGNRYIPLEGFSREQIFPMLEEAHLTNTRSGGYKLVPMKGTDKTAILILFLDKETYELRSVLGPDEYGFLEDGRNNEGIPWIIESGPVFDTGYAVAIFMQSGDMIYASDINTEYPLIGWSGESFCSGTTDDYSYVYATVMVVDNEYADDIDL